MKRKTTSTSMTRKAMNSTSVRRAAKSIGRTISKGVRGDMSAFEARAKAQANRHLIRAKRSFQRSTARVEAYIKRNPKKAVVVAAIIAAGIAATAAHASRK